MLAISKDTECPFHGKIGLSSDWSVTALHDPVRSLKEKCVAYNLSLFYKGKKFMTTTYSAGVGNIPGWKPRMTLDEQEVVDLALKHGKAKASFALTKHLVPYVEDVLYCLVNDSGAADYACFEDWARDMGVDPDSRKGEGVYRVCLETYTRLRAVVGDSGITALKEIFQDY